MQVELSDDHKLNSRVKNRIRLFYRSFGNEQWNKCFELVDPKLHTQLDHDKYVDSLRRFYNRYGPVKVQRIMELKVHECGGKRDGREFAVATVIWQDKNHGRHILKERWVNADGEWYTRAVGFVTPTS